ncbi:hypothetical protein RhiirA5_384383, partial [Rhizophagus irregularis]
EAKVKEELIKYKGKNKEEEEEERKLFLIKLNQVGIRPLRPTIPRRAAISLTIERACLRTKAEEADKENQTPKKQKEVLRDKEERERKVLEIKHKGESSKVIFEEGEEDERRTYFAELAWTLFKV